MIDGEVVSLLIKQLRRSPLIFCLFKEDEISESRFAHQLYSDGSENNSRRDRNDREPISRKHFRHPSRLIAVETSMPRSAPHSSTLRGDPDAPIAVLGETIGGLLGEAIRTK